MPRCETHQVSISPVDAWTGIEDDVSVREGLEGLLKSAAIQVDTFGSAKEFLDRGGKQAPGCLLLDVELPGLSGMALQAELVSRGINLPIIFLAGHGNIELCVQAMKGWCSGILHQAIRPGIAIAGSPKGFVSKSDQTASCDQSHASPWDRRHPRRPQESSATDRPGFR